ncbi:MAG: tetratricopeptide repeat protein [Crocinitomicaceae bacterium]|nr:tetratricopeptide repeat protein [Crocinitomicaceae bacterium]
MKLVLHIGFVLLCSLAFGQEWRDSLDVARKAYKNKDYEKALKYYKSAQKNAPDNLDLSDEMGQSAYKARNFEDAEKIYQQNSNTKKSNAAKADNYHNIGNSRMKSKNYQGAVDAYKESLRINPNDDKTRYNLSEAIRQVKNQQKKEQQQGDSGDKGNQGQQGNQGQKGNNQSGQQDQQNGGSQGGDNGSEGSNQGQLPNKTVERMLDQLMKEEAETKRRMAGNGGGGFSPKSGKDW